MASSGMLRRVALVRTDVSEEHSASLIRVKRICELGTTLSLTTNRRTLQRNTNWLCSSETSVITRSTQRNIPEDAILHRHRRKNLKSYMFEKCYIFVQPAQITANNSHDINERTSQTNSNVAFF
jgi:hypothetical protein